MNDWFSAGVTLFMTKAGIILASVSMATFAVLSDAKRHTFWSAILAIVTGTTMGVIAAASIVALMGWPEQVGYGVASVFAIAGDRLIKSIMRAAENPLSAWNQWRNKE